MPWDLSSAERVPSWIDGYFEKLKGMYPNADYDHLTMVGHSNGGDIAVYFAKLHPDEVRKVVTLDNLRVPFMTDGAGARWIGDWFGTGQARGIALVFIVVGVLGLGLTAYALSSRYYRVLSARYRESSLPTREATPSPDLPTAEGPMWHAARPAGHEGKGPDGTQAGIERRSRTDAE